MIQVKGNTPIYLALGKLHEKSSIGSILPQDAPRVTALHIGEPFRTGITTPQGLWPMPANHSFLEPTY